MQNERFEYWDCFRGLAMVLVVFCHVFSFSFGIKEDYVANRFACTVMLPIFFFITGWFSRLEFPWSSLYGRIKNVLVPTVMMFLLYEIIRGHGIVEIGNSLGREFKSGYWFPFALVAINFVHTLVAAGLKGKNPFILVGLLLISGFLVVLKDLDIKYNGGHFCQWFSLLLLSSYFPFYVVGVLARFYSDIFHRLVTNKWIAVASLAMFLFMLFCSDLGFYKAEMRSMLGLFVLYVLFYALREFFSSKTFVGRQMSLIGRYTLQIYLIHYFLMSVINLSWVRDWVPVEHEVIWTIMGLALTLVLVYLSILIAKAVAIYQPLYRLLLGK